MVMNAYSNLDPSVSITCSRFPEIVKVLAKFFVSRNVRAYLVGGIVRDAVLKRSITDIDLAVAADTSEIASDLASATGSRVVPLDSARCIVRVIIPASQVITVDISPIERDILGDLSCRDFALDAMAVSIADLEVGNKQLQIIDPHGGLADLKSGSVTALAPSIFDDDAARLMRGPRLAAQLGFSLSEETKQWIRERAELVTRVASERVRDELLKILAAPGASASLRMLDELCLLSSLFPELDDARGVSQPQEHYWDVFDHSIETVGQVERIASRSYDSSDFVEQQLPDFPSFNEYFAELVSDGHTRLTLLKFAGLLHDIAKPSTKTVESTGRVRFIGHGKNGAEISAHILDRLRLSSRGSELICRMVEHHLRPSQLSQNEEVPSRKAIHRYYRDLGGAAIDTIYLSLADYLAARGPNMRETEWASRCRVIGHVLQAKLECDDSVNNGMLINGNDIMNMFGLSPGQRVGLLLEMVKEAHAGGDIVTKNEALNLVRLSIESGGIGA